MELYKPSSVSGSYRCHIMTGENNMYLNAIVLNTTMLIRVM